MKNQIKLTELNVDELMRHLSADFEFMRVQQELKSEEFISYGYHGHDAIISWAMRLMNQVYEEVKNAKRD